MTIRAVSVTDPPSPDVTLDALMRKVRSYGDDFESNETLWALRADHGGAVLEEIPVPWRGNALPRDVLFGLAHHLEMMPPQTRINAAADPHNAGVYGVAFTAAAWHG